jgi:hypothetical protein
MKSCFLKNKAGIFLAAFGDNFFYLEGTGAGKCFRSSGSTFLNGGKCLPGSLSTFRRPVKTILGLDDLNAKGEHLRGFSV